ncbi:sporulation protein [Clostridium tetani]|uniref:Sporulation protein YtfJ n=1 Tax=Clostridium tetani TaxID=1513 RepID=A0ABY0ELG8_CLOTA|nr:GerW family sporulation protein [Clostridium tetani]KHO38947.1 sporulation protein [Clostridium tetani]RXI38047.1 sporulation protein YtfJ [Clostridium tetani]RXI52397.1 sporulation protein YtfJ [Clostridium tetani]RXI70036.1 sporulation protein YtfJ [Clostridium tetani]
MENHPIENLMQSTMENIKNMVDVNTIVGNTILTPDGASIIPISKVSFGFASGGSEYNSSISSDLGKYPFGGGSGAGVSLKPVAFLFIKSDSVRLLPVDQTTPYDRVIDTVPQLVDMFKDMSKSKASSNNANKSPIPNE